MCVQGPGAGRDKDSCSCCEKSRFLRGPDVSLGGTGTQGQSHSFLVQRPCAPGGARSWAEAAQSGFPGGIGSRPGRTPARERSLPISNFPDGGRAGAEFCHVYFCIH